MQRPRRRERSCVLSLLVFVGSTLTACQSSVQGGDVEVRTRGGVGKAVMIAGASLFVVVLAGAFATRSRPPKTRVDGTLTVATVVAIVGFVLGCFLWFVGV